MNKYNKKTFFKSLKCFIFGHKWLLQKLQNVEVEVEPRTYIDKVYAYYKCPYCNSVIQNKNINKRPNNSKRNFFESLDRFIDRIIE